MSYPGPFPITIADGGTDKTAVTIAPAATSWAGWDSHSNLSANNFLSGYATTATAAATTTLLVGSKEQQYFTGSTAGQIVLMPVVSTLALGQTYTIVNNSSAVVTVKSSGANVIQAMATGTTLKLTVVSTSGTTAASWSVVYSGTISINTLTLGGLSNIVGSDALSVVTGNITISDGNLDLTLTTFPFPESTGSIKFGGVSSIFTDGDNFVCGPSSGAGLDLTSGSNTFIGSSCGRLTNGSTNACIGSGSLYSATSGNDNTCCGTNALKFLLIGNNNLALGIGAGINYTSSESSNILLGNSGVALDQNMMRLGDASNTSQTFIYGFSGNAVSNLQYVTIDTVTNELGSADLPAVFTWTQQSTSTTMSALTGYFTTAAVTLTFPSSPSTGDTISIIVNSIQTVILQAAASQIIRIGANASTVAGTMTNSSIGDSVTFVYDSFHTVWASNGAPQGLWTPA